MAHISSSSKAPEKVLDSRSAPPTSVQPGTPEDPELKNNASAEQVRLLQQHLDEITRSHPDGNGLKAHEESPGGAAGIHASGSGVTPRGS